MKCTAHDAAAVVATLGSTAEGRLLLAHHGIALMDPSNAQGRGTQGLGGMKENPGASAQAQPDEEQALLESQAEVLRAQELLALKAQQLAELAELQAKARVARASKEQGERESDSSDTEDAQTQGLSTSQVGARVDARRRRQKQTWAVDTALGGRRANSRSRSPESKALKETKPGEEAVEGTANGSSMLVDAAVAGGG